MMGREGHSGRERGLTMATKGAHEAVNGVYGGREEDTWDGEGDAQWRVRRHTEVLKETHGGGEG